MENKEKVRNIGIPGIEAPAERCNDVHCPFHGKLGVRGRTYVADVLNKKTISTAIVQWNRRLFVPKYERFEKRKSKLVVHCPPCLHIHKNDKVVVGECRPLSKAKKFVVIKRIEDKK